MSIDSFVVDAALRNTIEPSSMLASGNGTLRLRPRLPVQIDVKIILMTSFYSNVIFCVYRMDCLPGAGAVIASCWAGNDCGNGSWY